MSHRVFICCCKGFFRDENRDELYQVLDVERRATAVEIKRAYRNKSLQMHPDKLNQRGQEVTEQDRADFQKMKGAYDVLSDPQKRELYDQLGETGMLMMEDPFAAKDNMIKNFLRMGTRDRLRLVIFVLLFVGAVLLWPILFCVKVDGDTSAKWVALWTPLWIYDALGLWYFIDLVSMGEIKPPEGIEEGWKDPSPLPLRVLALVKWVLLVLFQIFLTMRLDEYITWSYASVGWPLLVWIGLQLLGHIYEATRPVPVDRTDESMLNEEEGGIPPDADKRDQAIAKRAEARAAALKDCVWIIQLTFLIIELDDKVDWSWWVVFLPTWIVLLTQLISYCVDCSLAKGLAAGMEGKVEEDLTQEEKTRMMAASQLFANAMTSCCCWSFTFVTVVLAVNAMAGADYSAFVIFIPQFSVAGILVCCMTCFICCVRAPGDDETDLDGNPISEQEEGITAPQHVETSYGTYTPPAVPGGGRGGKGGVASSSSPPPGASAPSGASSAAVIAMPLPPPPVASTAAVGAGGAGTGAGGDSDGPGVVNVESVASASPVVASTPAPENQADGGID